VLAILLLRQMTFRPTAETENNEEGCQVIDHWHSNPLCSHCSGQRRRCTGRLRQLAGHIRWQTRLVLDRRHQIGQVSEGKRQRILWQTLLFRGEVLTKKCSLSEASYVRDALARTLYTRLFDYVVLNINNLLSFSLKVINYRLIKSSTVNRRFTERALRLASWTCRVLRTWKWATVWSNSAATRSTNKSITSSTKWWAH